MEDTENKPKIAPGRRPIVEAYKAGYIERMKARYAAPLPGAAEPIQGPGAAGQGQETPSGEAPSVSSPPSAAARVLRVREGLPATRQGLRDYTRTFSVVLDRPTEDLAVVAAAVDPQTGCRIPTPGDSHPLCADQAARPPIIFPVGFRERSGVMIADHSRFYNVRSKYLGSEPAEPQPGSPLPVPEVPQ